MTKQLRAVFHGHVQGVWFRAFTREHAVKEGLTGWVRNLPDGSVEALFEGEEARIRRVLEICRQGPPAARVARIDEEWSSSGNEFTTFDIRH